MFYVQDAWIASYPATIMSCIIGLFYFTFGNIKPEFRSTLRAIQLLCVVKTDFIEKYGIDEILTPFMSAIKQLECVSTHIHIL